MIAAIYCPGPSLRTHIERKGADVLLAGYDRTWAVNNALKLVDTDWLAAGDSAWFNGLLGPHRPRVGVVTMGSNRKTVADDASWRDRAIITWDDVPLIAEHHRRGRPINWSLQSALCHATQLGAKRIEVYGCDLVGTTDAAGYKGEDRSAERWARELLDLEFTANLLAEHGTTVTRITAPC